MISILFLTSLSVFSQGTMATNNASNQNIGATNSTASAKSKKSHELPESLLNLEVPYERFLVGGIAVGLGVKAMIGSKNTGLLLGYMRGIGSSDYTYNSFKLGYQYGIVRGFYANANFNLATMKPYFAYYPQARTIRVNLGIGYTLSFGKKKRLYYNIETAFAVINTNSNTLPRFAIYSGLGFRLGTPAKTSYEGVKNVTTVPMK